MSSKLSKLHSKNELRQEDLSICWHCGGNGYMKTTPNCYHTCLQCLGKGKISTST